MTAYVTTEEAASILGIKVATLRAYRARDQLAIEPAGHFGKALMWNRAEVERLARLRRGEAA